MEQINENWDKIRVRSKIYLKEDKNFFDIFEGNIKLFCGHYKIEGFYANAVKLIDNKKKEFVIYSRKLKGFYK